MRIAILGGSFDPPHLGHILIARQVLEHLPIDKVLLTPVASHAFNKSLSSASHRYNMVKLIQEKNIEASDFEIKIGNISRTINTLRALNASFPNSDHTFIIGSDQLKDFNKWDKWEMLIKEFGLIIFPREIAQKHLKEIALRALSMHKIPKNIKLLDNKDMILTNISSTKIRDRVKKKSSIRNLVSDEIETYINKHKLYE